MLCVCVCVYINTHTPTPTHTTFIYIYIYMYERSKFKPYFLAEETRLVFLFKESSPENYILFW